MIYCSRKSIDRAVMHLALCSLPFECSYVPAVCWGCLFIFLLLERWV